MRFAAAAFALALLPLLPAGAAAQRADGLSPSEAGAEAGARAGEAASVRGAVWGSAAATFVLTPFVGGIGSLVVAQRASADPPGIPETTDASAHPDYREAYRDAYRESFGPRYRRAIRTSVLLTSVAFFVGAALFAG